MSDENKVDLTAFETALARLEDALKQVETEWCATRRSNV